MKKLVVILSLIAISLSSLANNNAGRVENNESTENNHILIDINISPNPVVNFGELEFILEEAVDEVFIFIANSSGKLVSSLPIGKTAAGKSSVLINTDGLQGFYIVGIQAGTQTGTCKMYVK